LATDATGAPTPLGIPKYNTSADAPSGLGFNAAMDALDALIAARVTSPAASWRRRIPGLERQRLDRINGDPLRRADPRRSRYATAALNATTAYQNALARINSKRSDTLRQFGYLGDIDPTSGVVNNVRVDPHNQFGGLQQMLRSNADEVQQARIAAEERGLHGGLAHKGITDAHYDLGNASQQLGSAFSGALGGYQDDQNSAAYARDQALYQAELEAARNAIENGQFNPADFSDTNYDNPTDNGNPSGTGGSTGTAATYAQRIVKAGLTKKQAKGVDPGIGAAILASAAQKAKKTTTIKAAGGGGRRVMA
jgi:hypothetical protein